MQSVHAEIFINSGQNAKRVESVFSQNNEKTLNAEAESIRSSLAEIESDQLVLALVKPKKEEEEITKMSFNFPQVGNISESYLPTTENEIYQNEKFTLISEWEGYVQEIDGDSFFVFLTNVEDEHGLALNVAKFNFSMLPKMDQERIEIGSIIRWILGVKEFADGQTKYVSDICLRQMPAYTAKGMNSALELAKECLDGINWDDETPRGE